MHILCNCFMCPAHNAYTAISFWHSHCVLHCITCSYYNYPSINTNAAKQFTVFFWHIRYRCNSGPEDKSAIVPHDMQALLRSTHKKRKNKAEQNKRKCKKVIPDYDAFPTNKMCSSKGCTHRQNSSWKLCEERVSTFFCGKVAIFGRGKLSYERRAVSGERWAITHEQ